MARELFYNKSGYYINDRGDIYVNSSFSNVSFKDPINCISEKQAKKLLAINKLMTIAKYLNDGWQPDWDYKHEKKYYIYVEDKQIKVQFVYSTQCNDIYFKSEELTKKAIEILGEEIIKLALCTDY